MCFIVQKKPVKVRASFWLCVFKWYANAATKNTAGCLISLKSLKSPSEAVRISGPTVKICWGKVARGYLKWNLSLSGAPLLSPVKVLTVCPYVMSPRSDFPLFPLPVSASISVLPLSPSLPVFTLTAQSQLYRQLRKPSYRFPVTPCLLCPSFAHRLRRCCDAAFRRGNSLASPRPKLWTLRANLPKLI